MYSAQVGDGLFMDEARKVCMSLAPLLSFFLFYSETMRTSTRRVCMSFNRPLTKGLVVVKVEQKNV